MTREERRQALSAAAASLLLLAGTLEAQQQAMASAIVAGHVRMADGRGDGVVSVRVQAVSQTGSVSAFDQTDSSGAFELRVMPGRYVLEAARLGLLTTEYGSGRPGLPGSPLVVSAGEREEIEILIHRAAGISGAVRDERGNPIANVSVEVRALVEPGKVGSSIAATAKTGADGAYRALALQPGDYMVMALPSNPPVGPRDGSVRFEAPAAQFFPLVDAPSQAMVLGLAANEERPGVDFTLRARPLTRVTCTLVAPAGVSISGEALAVVTGIDDTAPVVRTPIVTPEGQFVVSLHPGRYRADVRSAGYVPTNQPARAQPYFGSAVLVVPDDTAAEFDIPLQLGARVSARVRGDSDPQPDVGLRLVPHPLRQAVVRPFDLERLEGGGLSASGVAPGRYGLELVDPGERWELRDVRVSGARRANRTVLVGEDEETEVLTRARLASVSGRLLAAQPNASAFVLVLLPDEGDSVSGSVPMPRLTRADNTGRYLFSRCSSGTYRLLVLADLDPASLRDREFVDGLRRHPAAVSITLRPNVEVTLDLRVAGGT